MSIASRAAKSITWTFDPTVPDEHDIIRERLLDNGGGIFTGRSVNEEKALGFVPVLAAVRLRAETVASLPLPVYRRLSRGKTVNRNHRAYSMLHDQANPEMSAFVFRETMQGFLEGWGNAFAEIEYDTDGFPLHLWPLSPARMQVGREDGKLVYLYRTLEGEEQKLNRRQVYHVPGMGWNGLVGFSRIQMARQAIALGLAAEEMAGRFYQNDARPGVVLMHPNELSVDASKRLAESFDATHSGLKNKHRTAVLEEGMTIETVGFPAEDAQLIEQQKWSVEQVARIFNVPPHLLHHLDRATFNNIEEMGLNFVTYSLRPDLVRWEQQIKMQLLGAWPKGGEFTADTNHFAEFNVEGLLRGKITDRMAAYWQRFQMGSLSPNEIRELENQNPIDGGDEYFRPANLNPLEAEEELPQLPPLQLATRSMKTAEDRRKVAERYRPLFERVTRELLAFEQEQVLAEADRRIAA